MNQYQTINPLMPLFIPSMIPPLTTCSPAQAIDTSDTIINVESGSTRGNPSPVSVTYVTTTTYNILSTDYFLCVDTETFPVTLTLPIGKLGTVYIIKDCTGDAATNPITIQGSDGQQVDGSSASVDSPYGSITVIFNGMHWSIV